MVSDDHAVEKWDGIVVWKSDGGLHVCGHGPHAGPEMKALIAEPSASDPLEFPMESEAYILELAVFLKYSANIEIWNEESIMLNRMMKADTAFAARAARGARVIWHAVFAGEGGSVSRFCIWPEWSDYHKLAVNISDYRTALQQTRLWGGFSLCGG